MQLKTLCVGLMTAGILTTHQMVMATNGAALYKEKNCHTCHGETGNEPITPAYPKIACQSKLYSQPQMQDIRDGRRTNGLSMAMQGLVRSVTDEEFALIADWLENQESCANTDMAIASDGATLYKAKACNACHGETGNEPIAPAYPQIACQSKQYSISQLQDIRDGKRHNSLSASMQATILTVTDKEFELIVEWLENQESCVEINTDTKTNTK